jgi:mannose-6-phosphate isomerase-like protein (cupin superfamily)
MAAETNLKVDVETTATKLPEGVLGVDAVTPAIQDGCTVYVHYNGPTDQLSGMCTGMAVLDPGASPHPPHQHPEEEFLIIASGTGEIECAGKTTQVGPGAIMYCAGNTIHGIVNTGNVPMTFYWSKWLSK